MTEKLYYRDSYMKEFTSQVLACEPGEKGYITVLSKTAFFPEEGGQYSDRGVIGNAEVVTVYERGGIIYHVTSMPLEVGSEVICRIDFDERYEKMQCHTAEHILSGLIHSEYGLSNVGFHLGADEVTMDISEPLTAEQLEYIECRANEIVFENVKIEVLYPTPSEAKTLEYRSKLDITENLRVVRIGEYDSCACCAPHVARTGELGCIKILDFSKLRGGIRIRIAAGRRAFRIFSAYHKELSNISRQLSAPRLECAGTLSRYAEETERIKRELKLMRIAFFEREADFIDTDRKLIFLTYEGASIEELRALANKLLTKTEALIVILAPTTEDVKYLIASKRVDVKSNIRQINSALCGRGGGNSEMAQGGFNSSVSDIRAYFEANYQ